MFLTWAGPGHELKVHEKQGQLVTDIQSVCIPSVFLGTLLYSLGLG
jgi:hypothetical protein